MPTIDFAAFDFTGAKPDHDASASRPQLETVQKRLLVSMTRGILAFTINANEACHSHAVSRGDWRSLNRDFIQVAFQPFKFDGPYLFRPGAFPFPRLHGVTIT